MANQSLTVNNNVYSATKKTPLVNRLTGSLSLIALAVLLVIMLFPFAIITLNSFKTETEYYANGPMSLPQSLETTTLTETWERLEFTTKLWNSIVISVSVSLLAIALSLFNAFALGIGKVKGRGFFLVFFLLAITLPNEVLAYPLYYLFRQIGLYDTRLSVILTLATLHTAFGTYLLTSVFSTTFPKELIEAAMIDGCNKMQLLFKVVVPVSMSTLAVLFVFFFIWTWNDFFLPLIFLISNSNQTVPLALALLQGQHGMVITTQSAAAFLGVLPGIIFFILFQRTLARGVTAGSVK
ncbi:MAG: carbohydrate ABC transporter permease [Anaerolineaceae bacterium]|nr:carbohydrate ABC transporter permease [Anaerolineaceae bacterium]MCB9099874.1 carbohydrate ABC transporter permease [Anaerolineales bacterium]